MVYYIVNKINHYIITKPLYSGLLYSKHNKTLYNKSLYNEPLYNEPLYNKYSKPIYCKHLLFSKYSIERERESKNYIVKYI